MKKRILSVIVTMCLVFCLLAPSSYASNKNQKRPDEGWYYLRTMNNYLNFDADDNAELRDKTNTPEGNTKFLLRYHGTGGYSLTRVDGKSLGLTISEATVHSEGNQIMQGMRLKAMETDPEKYIVRWNLYSDNNDDIYHLRPRTTNDMVVNASGEKNEDGTHIILWTHIDKWTCPAFPYPDSPKHAQFRFIPAENPYAGSRATPNDGWHNIKITNSSAKYMVRNDNGDAEMNEWSRQNAGTREYYVENRGNYQITLRMVDGRYLGLSDPIRDGVRVKAVNAPYLWNCYSEDFGVGNINSFSLRPPNATNMLLVLDGNPEVGAPIKIKKYKSFDAPQNGELTFSVLNENTGNVPTVKLVSQPLTSESTVPLGTIATPSKTSFVMNQRPISVTSAYSIEGKNYLQLREIATMLSGTSAQFDVGWDGQYAVIEPNKPYSGTITQSSLEETTDIRDSSTQFSLNGEVFQFEDAKLIDGDTNYLQLREFAQKLSNTASKFNVYWDENAGQAVIVPGVAYTGVESAAQTTAPPVPKQYVVPAQLDNTTIEEWDVLRYTNIERAKANLPLFVTFDRMQKMAGIRSDELVDSFSHTRPNGSDPNTVLSENNFSASSFGENIAYGQKSGKEVVNDWMNSDGHRANILTESFRYMGAGFTKKNDLYWAQIFAGSQVSKCESIEFYENSGYFKIKLSTGITAYAPYDPISSPFVDGKVTFNYPGSDSAVFTTVKE